LFLTRCWTWFTTSSSAGLCGASGYFGLECFIEALPRLIASRSLSHDVVEDAIEQRYRAELLEGFDSCECPAEWAAEEGVNSSGINADTHWDLPITTIDHFDATLLQAVDLLLAVRAFELEALKKKMWVG